MTSRRALLAWWADEDPPARVTLDRSACLNSFADFCATCVERCPVEGAILLVGRHPVVVLPRDGLVATQQQQQQQQQQGEGAKQMVYAVPAAPADDTTSFSSTKVWKLVTCDV